MSAPATDAPHGYTPAAPILPSWKKVWKWYNGRKQSKAAAAFNTVIDGYRCMPRSRR